MIHPSRHRETTICPKHSHILRGNKSTRPDIGQINDIDEPFAKCTHIQRIIL